MAVSSAAAYHSAGSVSGLDIQAIVDNLVKIKGAPISTLQARETAVTADIAAWADINTDMTALTDSLYTLQNGKLWDAMMTISTEASITATATSSAIKASYTIHVTNLAAAHSIASDQAGALSPGATAATDLVAAGVLVAGDQFTIEGQVITIGATESVNSLSGKINTASQSMPTANKVIATVLDNRLVITRANTGSTNITLSNTTNTPLTSLGIFTGGGALKNELVPAANANFTVNGASVSRSSNTSISDVISNVTLNLVYQPTADVTLSISPDTTSAKTAITTFIEAYNAVVAKLSEYGKADISAATGDGSSISVGELQDDPMVRSILANMRKLATGSKAPYIDGAAGATNATFTYDGATTKCVSLDNIGIGTLSKENQIAINDETKLDYMLANNFDIVTQLFRGVPADTYPPYQHGVASDFYQYSNTVTELVSGDIARRKTTLNEQVADFETQISKIESDLIDYTQQLWETFGAMEDTISSLKSQLTALTSKLGS